MHDLLKQLTIVVPVYNDAKYLAATIESCLSEAGTIALYDNASTDGSSEICADFANRYPQQIRHIRHAENVGAFENMKRALADCQTPYFSLLGSHDQLTAGYSLPLLATLSKDAGLSLACGTIQHMDENGTPLKKRTTAYWINDTQALPALARADVFVRKLRDCFAFYGIFRTDALRRAWHNEASLGFDRIVLIRTASQGKIVYVPESIFLARDFVSTRKTEDDRTRRMRDLALAPAQKSNFQRNHTIAKTILDMATNDTELTQAFATLQALDNRLHNRRRFQRLRILQLAGLLIFATVCLMVVFD